MPKQLSKTSQSIAGYALGHGIGVDYRTAHVTLGDGRDLTITFYDPLKRGVESSNPNSMLFIDLLPIRDDQIGYASEEHGLTGEVEYFAIYPGTKGNGEGSGDLVILPSGKARLPRRLRANVQEKYGLLLEEVHAALSGK